ncbi:MAG: leucine-rich repeat protein, partial [Christensenellaceae bacterium]|nr:leucine-rich repeat protein [Christensenellaceae bacterium]
GAASDGGSGASTGAPAPTLQGIDVRGVNSDATTPLNGALAAVALTDAGTAEDVTVTLRLMNSSKLPLSHFSVNGIVYNFSYEPGEGKFVAKNSNNNVFTFTYSTDKTTGTETVTVTDIVFLRGSTGEQIKNLSGLNSAQYLINPTYKIATVLTNSNGEKITHETNIRYLQNIVDVQSSVAYSSVQMSSPENNPPNYIFTGWYSSETGGEKLDVSGKFIFYQDKTFYAQYKPLFTYNLVNVEEGGEQAQYAEITGATTEGRTQATLNIGKYIDGYTVKFIGESAFAQKLTSLISATNIVINAPVKEIKKNAFYDFKGAVTIVPQTMTVSVNNANFVQNVDYLETIGEYAFYGALRLLNSNGTYQNTAFYLPRSVVSIGAHAFERTSWDTPLSYYGTAATVTLKNTLVISSGMQIGANAFDHSFFEKVVFASYIFDKEQVVDDGYEDFVPEEITIGTNAFVGSEMRDILWNGALIESGIMFQPSISSPTLVKTISSGAFKECKYISAFNFTEGIETIGPNAFALFDPTSLLSAATGNFKRTAKGANGQNITAPSLVIPDSVKTIGLSAFAGWDSIQTITISPQSALISIDRYAFVGAEISELVINSLNLTTYHKSAIGGNEYIRRVVFKSLTAPTIPSETLTLQMFADYVRYIVPSESKAAYDAAFKNSSVDYSTSFGNISFSVTRSAGVFGASEIITTGGLQIGYKFNPDGITAAITFINNTSISSPLLSVTVPATLNIDGANVPVTRVCQRFLFPSVVSVGLPDSITVIDPYAFYDNAVLSSVKVGTAGSSSGVSLPVNLEAIGAFAFYHDILLNGKLAIPDKVKIIGEGAFAGTVLLNSVSYNPTFTNSYIGIRAFENSGITKAVLGMNILFDEEAFANCPNLNNVYLGYSGVPKRAIIVTETVEGVPVSRYEPDTVEWTFTPFVGCDNIILYIVGGAGVKTTVWNARGYKTLLKDDESRIQTISIGEFTTQL